MMIWILDLPTLSFFRFEQCKSCTKVYNVNRLIIFRLICVIFLSLTIIISILSLKITFLIKWNTRVIKWNRHVIYNFEFLCFESVDIWKILIFDVWQNFLVYLYFHRGNYTYFRLRWTRVVFLYPRVSIQYIYPGDAA